MSDYSQDAEPVDGIKEVYYGFVVTSSSNDEVSNLLGLFNMIATVSAFIAGIIMTAFTSINIQELQFAEEFMHQNGFSTTIVFTGMEFCSALGLVFSGIAILGSAALSISLSSLNLGGDHPCCDAFVLEWMKKFHFYYVLTLFSLWACVIFMTFGLYFIGCIKYPTLANGQNSFIYGAIGVFFMIFVTISVYIFMSLHVKMIEMMKAEFQKFNESSNMTRNPMSTKTHFTQQPMPQSEMQSMRLSSAPPMNLSRDQLRHQNRLSGGAY